MSDLRRAMERVGSFRLALAGVVLLALAWRYWAHKYHYWTMDEEIPLAVLLPILIHGTLDTNWANTEVNPLFRYDQFNFSSYHLFAALLSLWVNIREALPPLEQRPLLSHLRDISTLLGGANVLLTGLLGRRIGGSAVGLVAAALVAVCVTLFQDSIYARPDAFATTLMLGLALCVTSASALKPISVMGAGLLAGLLVACKITFIAIWPFALLAILSQIPDRPAHRAALLYFVASGAGFALGAPYALREPGKYLFGVQYLLEQYSGGHWPHGLPDADVLGRWGYALDYLNGVLGLPCLVGIAVGLVLLGLRGSTQVRLIYAGVLLTALYFMQSRAFFERNLSHALPFLFIACAFALVWAVRQLPARWPRQWLIAVLALVVALHPAWVTHQLVGDVLAGQHAARVAVLEQSIKSDGTTLINASHDPQVLSALLDKHHCQPFVYRFAHFGDRYTSAWLADLTKAHRLERIAEAIAPFDGIPPSTLHTYHATNVLFLKAVPDAAECPATLVRLPENAVQRPVFDIRLTGQAVHMGHHPGSAPPQWAKHVYATWNGADANKGTIELETELCAGDIVPVIFGPADGATELAIHIDQGDGMALWYQIAGMPVAGWSGLQFMHPSGGCFPARITATDASDAWGAWVGVGSPARQVD